MVAWISIEGLEESKDHYYVFENDKAHKLYFHELRFIGYVIFGQVIHPVARIISESYLKEFKYIGENKKFYEKQLWEYWKNYAYIFETSPDKLICFLEDCPDKENLKILVFDENINIIKIDKKYYHWNNTVQYWIEFEDDDFFKYKDFLDIEVFVEMFGEKELYPKEKYIEKYIIDGDIFSFKHKNNIYYFSYYGDTDENGVKYESGYNLISEQSVQKIIQSKIDKYNEKLEELNNSLSEI